MLAFLTVAGCSKENVGYGVALTIRFDTSVSDADLARVTQLRYQTSGGESYMTTAPLGRAANRLERVVYRPEASTHALEIDVAGLDTKGVVVAEGSTGTLTMTAGKTTNANATLTIANGIVPDMATPPDAATVPDVGVDAGPPVVSFSSVATAPILGGPGAVAVGDWNGDKRDDIAVSSTTSAMIQVFFSQADGTPPATPNVTLSNAGAASSLVAGDFTHDGVLDIASLDSSTGSIFLFAGNGAGQFASPTTVAGASGADSMVAADFDGDGKLDFALASSTQAQLTIVWGDGSMSTSLSPASYVTRMHAADLDGNGSPDLVVMVPGQQLVEVFYTRLVTSKKTLSSPTPLSLNTEPLDFVLADIDGDGDRDIFVYRFDTTPNTGSVATYFLNNNGFESASGVVDSGNASQFGVLYALTADFDKDGRDDILGVAEYVYEGVFVALGRAGSSPDFFNSANAVTTYGAAGATGPVAIGDFDHDGNLDVVVRHADTKLVSVALGSATGALRAAKGTYFGPPRIYDIDGDSLPDLITHNNGIVTLTNIGNFTFAPRGYIYYPTNNPTASAVGDLNHDGKIDLVAVDSQGQISVALGTAPGQFGSFTSGTLDTAFVDVVVADINHDGNLDVIALDTSSTASTAGQNVAVLTGDGTGAGAQQYYGSAPNAVAFVVRDFTGDGTPDVAVVTQSGALYVLLAASNALVAATPNATGVVSPTAITSLDANGDGKADLAIAGSNGVRLFLGAGDGSFADGASLYDSPVTSVVAGRVDSDTHDDLVVATAHSFFVLSGAKANATPPTFYAGEQIADLHGGDFNNDGRLDVVVHIVDGYSYLAPNTSP